MTSQSKFLLTLHYTPTHIRKQLEDAHQQGLHDQVLFSHNHNAFTSGENNVAMHYFYPKTVERLDIRVYKSPIDRPSTRGSKSTKAIIITARGKCLPRPVLLARCPGHIEILKIWNPESDHADKIVKWRSKTALKEELQARIDFLAVQAGKNAVAAQARRNVSPEDRPSVSEQPLVSNRLSRAGRQGRGLPAEDLDTRIPPPSNTENQLAYKQENERPLVEQTPKATTAVTVAVPATTQIIDLTSDDDLDTVRFKREVIGGDYIKEATMIFFTSAAGVIVRKSPLSEVANARSLYLHFTTAFTLNTHEDVLMFASINGGRAIRLVSNCKGDFDSLWLAGRNDMCWYQGSDARVMCKVDMRMA